MTSYAICMTELQDLDTELVPSYRHVSRGKTWRSNDGLITPVSVEGCSPYESPAASPHRGLPAR